MRHTRITPNRKNKIVGMLDVKFHAPLANFFLHVAHRQRQPILFHQHVIFRAMTRQKIPRLIYHLHRALSH